MGGLDVWITKYGVNYTFYQIERRKAGKSLREKPDGKPTGIEEFEEATLLGHRVLYELQNHNAEPQKEGKQRQEGYYNYLIGNDPSKHASYVGLYKEALVKNVYNGIDLRYYFDKGYLRYDYIVHAGADPSQIKFKLRGQYNDFVKDGKIIYTTRFGEVALADLHTYQGNTTIPSKFVKQGDAYTFALGNYDRTKDLIIDPLVYSTYIGGSDDDRGFGIAVDASGNAYVTGHTRSTNYDVTAGAFQTTHGGGTWDVFVTKLNATGAGLVYSTYIGGSNYDYGRGIAVDASGNAYVMGETRSAGYDVTAGSFQTTNGGNYDVFVTKLNATGTALVYSTYIGGSSDDYGRGIAVDASGNAYVTGYTYSTDYDVTAGAFQTTNGGSSDVFVTKLNATGTALVYSTYIGGSTEDRGYGIAVDASGNAYVTGWTNSTNYDVTAGAFQTTNGGGSDVFVTKLCPGATMNITLSSAPSTNNQSVCINTAITPITYTTTGATGATFSGLPAGVTGSFNNVTKVVTISGTPTASGTFNYTVTLTGVCGSVTASGTIAVNLCTSLNPALGGIAFEVYPNPSRGAFIIKTARGGSFELVDITGKVIRSYVFSQSEQFIREELSAGMYFIREKESGAVQKLVVE